MSEKIFTTLAALVVGVIGGYAIAHAVPHEHDHEKHDDEMQGMSAEGDMDSMENMEGVGDMDMSNMTPEEMLAMHPPREVDPDLPIPQVTMEVEEDPTSGYNLTLTTENFTFTPEDINTDAVANEGHAHLFVNGEKVARLYSPWFNIKESYFTEGMNSIEVTLNANDHTTWVIDGGTIGASMRMNR